MLLERLRDLHQLQTVAGHVEEANDSVQHVLAVLHLLHKAGTQARGGNVHRALRTVHTIKLKYLGTMNSLRECSVCNAL